MTSAMWELHKAAFTRINGNLTDCPVYSRVPDDASYPFVAIQEPVSVIESKKGCQGELITLTFDIWHTLGENYSGSIKTVVDISNEITTLITTCFDGSPNFLSLASGFTVVRQDFEGLNIVENVDDSIKHGVLTMIFMVQET